MTAKEKLKAAVDRLTEAEAANAEIVVRDDSWLDTLPVTPVTPDEEAALAEADADRAAGVPLISHEEVMREFGLEQ